jgi:hypothetical protein
MKMSDNGFPRRNRIDLYTPAETAIREAMLAVESSGAHPLLTDAVSLLEQAKNKVADFVDLADHPAPPVNASADSRAEEAYKSALIDREIATALAGWDLVPGAMSQLIKAWRGEFLALDDGDEIRVRTRQGWTVAHAVADWFRHFPEYHGFLKRSGHFPETP